MRTRVLAALACALLACGDGGGAGADAGGGGEDAGAPDTTRDGSAPDGSAPDAGAAGCGPCDAEAPWRCDRCLGAAAQEIVATVLDGRIVVAGGIERGVVPTVRVYDPAADVWGELPELPEPRHHVQLVAFAGDLYALGGMRDLGFDALRTAWVLRAGADAWTPIADLPRARAAGFAGVVEGRIVLVGGHGAGRADTDKLEAGRPALLYDPAEDAWSEGALMPTPREHCAGFVHEGELWVLGGRPLTLEPTFDTVEIYDPAEDRWRAGPAMASGHGGFAAAAAGGRAWAVGGEERARALDLVEELDLESETWRSHAPVPTPRHGHAMAAIGGRVYVIGGADEPVFAAVDVVESFAIE
ncbi:MAG TPA: kelch repeat-containing protein [Polyangiaceae bacterium LLY-WYZ-15_(1-7)]|nr:kelch repeat-containing protein [Polyangiaceae bacterium LLY-WYZ-15_(1-7)]